MVERNNKILAKVHRPLKTKPMHNIIPNILVKFSREENFGLVNIHFLARIGTKIV